MPVQSNTSRVAPHDFQKKMGRLDDFLSKAKEAGVISHPNQEYKEAFVKFIYKMLQNTPQQIEKTTKKLKEFLELLKNDEKAAHSFYEKELQNLGIPTLGEKKDDICTDLQLIKQFVVDYF